MPSQRILTIDARMLFFSGIGVVLRHLISRLPAHLPDLQIHLLIHPQDTDWVNSHLPEATTTTTPAHIYSLQEQVQIAALIPQNTALLWVPHFNIPMFSSVPLVTTIHDVCHLARPKDFPHPVKRFVARQLIQRALQRSHRVVCVSEATRSELHQHLRVPHPERMSVIHNGVDSSWFSPVSADKPTPHPYLIAVANLKPHKNLHRLIQAFLQIKDTIPHQLIIAGDTHPKGSHDTAAIELAGEHPDRVLLLGTLQDQEKLVQLVAHADGLIFPSLYEGFGLPPLEAMASGCPVACSSIAPLREVCGEPFQAETNTGNAFYFQPEDLSSISQCLSQLAQLPEPSRRQLIQNGKARAQTFDWDRSASQYAQIFMQALQ